MKISCSGRGLKLEIPVEELELLQSDLRKLPIDPRRAEEDGTTLQHIAGAVNDALRIALNVKYYKTQKAARAAQKGKKP